MCRRSDEGGMRCAAHTRPAYEAALDRLQLHPEGEQMAAALDALDDAGVAYGSTPEGRERFLREMEHAEATGNWYWAATLRTFVQRGEQMAAAANEVAFAVDRQRAARSTDGSIPEYTYPARLQAAKYAETSWLELQTEAEDRAAAAGGAYPADMCTSCGHTHLSGPCTEDECRCATHTEPSLQQVEAYHYYDQAAQAHDEYVRLWNIAQSFHRGDRFVVARGRKVPIGTAGALIRTHDGDYGARALIQPADGEPVWVSVENLERIP